MAVVALRKYALGNWILSGLDPYNKGGRDESTIYKINNVPRDFLDHYQQEKLTVQAEKVAKPIKLVASLH